MRYVVLTIAAAAMISGCSRSYSKCCPTVMHDPCPSTVLSHYNEPTTYEYVPANTYHYDNDNAGSFNSNGVHETHGFRSHGGDHNMNRSTQTFNRTQSEFVDRNSRGLNQSKSSSQFRVAGAMAAQDDDFLRDAAMMNLAEIEMGQIGIDNAESEEVKEYAQTLIDDHTQAQADIRSLALGANIIPNQLDSHHQNMATRLSAKSGGDFDREFMEMMVRDHRDAIRKFEDRANKDPKNQVSDMASKMIPKLRAHLQEAENIQSQLGFVNR